MRICDSWCEHIDCNEIRSKCTHPIEDRQFYDWDVESCSILRVHGKCLKCKMYVSFTVKRSKEMLQARSLIT